MQQIFHLKCVRYFNKKAGKIVKILFGHTVSHITTYSSWAMTASSYSRYKKNTLSKPSTRKQFKKLPAQGPNTVQTNLVIIRKHWSWSGIKLVADNSYLPLISNSVYFTGVIFGFHDVTPRLEVGTHAVCTYNTISSYSHRCSFAKSPTVFQGRKKIRLAKMVKVFAKI
jgi:hypothetical protein